MDWVTLALVIAGTWMVLALCFALTSNPRAKDLAKAFAWRVPTSLMLIHAGKLSMDWAVAALPLHANLARNAFTLVVVLVAGLVYVKPFLKAKADPFE